MDVTEAVKIFLDFFGYSGGLLDHDIDTGYGWMPYEPARDGSCRDGGGCDD